MYRICSYMMTLYLTERCCERRGVPSCSTRGDALPTTTLRTPVPALSHTTTDEGAAQACHQARHGTIILTQHT